MMPPAKAAIGVGMFIREAAPVKTGDAGSVADGGIGTTATVEDGCSGEDPGGGGGLE